MAKSRVMMPEQVEEIRTKDYFDTISPGVAKFYSDYYVIGNSYKSVWMIKSYPSTTSTQAILSQLSDRSGVTIRQYNRQVSVDEQNKIIQNSARKNILQTASNDVTENVKAQENLNDVYDMIANLRKNNEMLLHTAVFIELHANDMNALKDLQSDIYMEIKRNGIEVDKLLFRQKEGMISVNPMGYNAMGVQSEQVLPASSVANMFPLNFSGKNDENGNYIGRDKYGTNILPDFDKRAEDKTTSNILILGNSGQGKSYLMKLLLTNIRETGKSIIVLDPEHEYEELCNNLGGCYIDLLKGDHIINPMEPKAWADTSDDCDEKTPDAFRKVTRLSQHIAFLKDFFATYNDDFTQTHINTIEILLLKLYGRFGIQDSTDFSRLRPTDYPTLQDFYDICDESCKTYDDKIDNLYPRHILKEVRLGIFSMCQGAESKYFNGHSNITDDKFIVFGVKGLMDSNKKLKDAMLFNILSYMSDVLLSKGFAAASIDELYLFLTNMTAIEYIRNAMKRVRKKESTVIVASQNIEDFLIPKIREFTKPLFSIPTHQFLFNPGQINPKDYMEALQIEASEYDLIKYPERGTCLYRCGNERYLLQVKAPDYKAELFGRSGGR